MKEYVELHDRVVSVELTPDTPGYCRRTLTVAVESGPAMTDEEYDRVSKLVVAELVSRGAIVHWWGYGEEDDTPTSKE